MNAVRDFLKKSKAARKAYETARMIAVKIFRLWIAPYLKIDKNKVVFINFAGRGYGCNPKYIAQEMLRQGTPHDLVWLVSDMDEPMPPQIRKVRFGSPQGLYELATAKVWVSNIKTALEIDKKRGQFYVQTWHGALPIKKIEWDAAEMLSKEYLKASAQDSKITDLMLSDSKFATELYRRSMRYRGEIMESGIPRNDLYHSLTEDVVARVYAYFGIERDKKIILYAPTFRNARGMAPYQFDYEKVRAALSKKFGCDCIFAIRLHPNMLRDCQKLTYTDTIKNATRYPDVQELIACSATLISDYSSCLFEAIYAGNAPLVYAKDRKEYMATERKFYFSFEELPFCVAETEEELLEHIDRMDFDAYKEQCKKFLSDMGVHERGDASKKAVERIEKQMRKS